MEMIPIELSIVELNRVEGGTLYVRNVDMIDGTPLLDIKPHVPEFDSPLDIRTGWLAEAGRPWRTEHRTTDSSREANGSSARTPKVARRHHPKGNRSEARAS